VGNETFLGLALPDLRKDAIIGATMTDSEESWIGSIVTVSF